VAAVLGATATAFAIWAVATAAGVDLTVSYDSGQPMQITVVNVVLAALVGSLAGWGLLALLRSLGGPLSATASADTKVSLVAMHLVVAAVVIVVMRAQMGAERG
jgi:hypothetical protein